MSKLFFYGVIIFACIQFIPYGKNHTNPPVLSQVQFDSVQTKELFDRACKDCHSNETVWPWYSYIAPISWGITHHIDEGREHFNISMIGHQRKNKSNEAAEEVEKGEMPLSSYLIAHPEARLTKEEKKQLIIGLEKTFGRE